MTLNLFPKNDPPSFSVIFFENIFVFYIGILSVLVVFTHMAQLMSLRFSHYAYISFTLGVTVVVIFIRSIVKTPARILQRDYLNLIIVLVLAFLCVFISMNYHRIGRISPDEFYYGAGPVYYISHSNENMGFELRTFYSQQTFFSLAYLTAGAYEYILAALSFLVDVQFVKLYYGFGAGIASFLIVISIYLLINKFTNKSEYILAGTFSIVCSIFMMGETVLSPGAYSFMRAFEGKSVFLFVGIPMFSYFSLSFFQSQNRIELFRLFMLTTATVGLTTTSIPMIPVLASTLFVSYVLSYLWKKISVREIIIIGLKYFLSFVYLLLFGAYLFFFGDNDAALFFNIGYDYSFWKYLAGFVDYSFPTTAVFVISSSLVLLLDVIRSRNFFLVYWIILVIAFVLNPIVASVHLKIFPGIYSRFFYIFPFPLILGVAIVVFFCFLENYSWFLRSSVKLLVIVSLIIGVVKLPTSVFQRDNYSRGTVLHDREFQQAIMLIEVTPPGIMLAPYPLSGAIQMLNGERPQILNRSDIIYYYLHKKTSLDGELRLRVSEFLNGGNEDYAAFFELIKSYPEIRSIIFNRQIYALFRDEIEQRLIDFGFSSFRDSGLVIFTR